MDFEHVITVKEGQYFSWSDKFAMGMLDHHVYKVEAHGKDQTRFIQSDMCKGGMTWLMGGTVRKFHETHYPKYNRALKAEVEKRFPR
ncbi:MAG: hypothetical protein AAF570_23610 [Bacteroidota bacterium]